MILENLFDNQTVKSALQQIISERDHYRKELSIANQAIQCLESHIIELDRLLANAHRQLYVHEPRHRPKRSLPKSWIGPWQCSPKEFPTLTHAEEAWRDGHTQMALTQIPKLLERHDLGCQHRINTLLLCSAMISSAGGDYSMALSFVEEALKLASQYRLYELAGKAQFHRGLCYFYLGQPAKAKWCFILASHLEDHEVTIRDCQLAAERQIEDLPMGDPKRTVPSDFRFFCHSEADRFVGQAFATNHKFYT